MDTTKGELSFSLKGVNLGVGYEGIPLDKPLVLCVVLGCRGGFIELNTSEVMKTKISSSVPVPSNITAKGIAWGSITLSWNIVEGVQFYQIEADGNKPWVGLTTNTFTKIGLLPDTEHSFRVCSICGVKVSEWSDTVKGRT